MKATFSQLLAAAITWLLFSVPGTADLHAQDNKPVYAYVTYIKVDRGKSDAYLNHVRSFGQQAYQDRIDRGEILGWSLFAVTMRTERSDDYNFVSVTTTNSLKSITDASQSTQQIMKRLRPDMSDNAIADMISQLNQMRVMVGNETLLRMDELASLQPGGSKYYEINYMKAAPGKESEYEKIESGTFKPVHKERQAVGDINGWAMWKVAYPYSDARPYNYVTVNSFSDMDKMVASDYTAAYKKAFPKGDMTKLAPQMTAARTMQKTEVWRREIRLSPAPKQ